MQANVTLDLDGVNDDRTEYAEDFGSVQVSINEEGDQPRIRCANCSEYLDEDGTSTEDGSKECAEADTEYDDNGDTVPGTDAHKPEPIPLSWVNSARITAHEDEDTITVAISVGDPRGAFVMRVERMRYTDEDGNERDELRLSVPTPEDSHLHMPLQPLASPGYYRIGH